MALEAIQEVTQAETRSKEQRELAAFESKQKLLASQRSAQHQLEEARQAAAAEVRVLMEQAETEAAKVTEEVMAQARVDCEAMKQGARGRLDQAAQLIVEKVVRR